MQSGGSRLEDPQSQYNYEQSLRRQVTALQDRCQELESRIPHDPPDGRHEAAWAQQEKLEHQEQQTRTLLAENGILLEEIAVMRRQLAELRSQSHAGTAMGDQSASHRERELEQSVQQLREEVDRLRDQNASLSAASGELREARHRNESLQASNAALEARVAELGGKLAELEADAETATFGQLRKTIKEFTLNTVMELEKKTTASATRAAAAEEQLDHIQKYMTQSTTAYQKEIMRLRKLVAQHAPDELQPRPGSVSGGVK
eukprot:jgi/Tetstr1/462351/TSEL_007357.t1